jgi:hypothetical protein
MWKFASTTAMMPCDAKSPVINGKDAIRPAVKPMLEDPNFALTFGRRR